VGVDIALLYGRRSWVSNNSSISSSSSFTSLFSLLLSSSESRAIGSLKLLELNSINYSWVLVVREDLDLIVAEAGRAGQEDLVVAYPRDLGAVDVLKPKPLAGGVEGAAIKTRASPGSY